MELSGMTNAPAHGDLTEDHATVCLRSGNRSSKLFFYYSAVLKTKSKFFADQLSLPNLNSRIEIRCSDSDYGHYIDLLNSLHIPSDSLLDSWKTVRSALGTLPVAVSLQCDEVTQSCVQYLEAVPWEDEEEEEIIKVVPKLGPLAMPILARVEPVDVGCTKDVFLAAIRFATSIARPCPPFGDELRASAQEQVEYMLGDDKDTPLVIVDDDIKIEARKGLSQLCSSFQIELSFLLSTPDPSFEGAGNRLLRNLSDLEWLCNILPQMNLMWDFVSNWAEISDNIIKLIEDQKFDSVLWGVKFKLIEVTTKVLEAVGYGNVIVSAPCRVQLLKTWLPYIRKMKPLLDSISDKDPGFTYRMDEDLCQSIEGAIVSLILALPSNDQAEILADWMENQQLGYPDLSEAFEIWCYRTKSAKRRFVEGLSQVSNGAVSSDLSV